MTDKLIDFRNKIFIIQRFQKVKSSSKMNIEVHVEKMGINKKDFLKDITKTYPAIFKNYSIQNLFVKLELKNWNLEQLITIYEVLGNENNTAIIKDYIEIGKSINTDFETSPFKIEWVHSYFMKKKKNFKSKYYSPDRWSADPEFMEYIYKLLFHGENFDLEAVV